MIAGSAVLGLPELKGGSGSYSIASCVNFAASSQLREYHQTGVDSGGHAATRDPIAIDHHACIGRLGSERAEAFARRPMGGRLVALEQASRTQQQRAATDRSDELGASAAVRKEGDHLAVGHQILLPEPSGHEQDVKLARAGGERRVRLNPNPGIGPNEVGRLPDQVDVREP